MAVSTSVLGDTKGTRVLIERMAEAATSWLASLAPDQRRKASHDFPANDERTLWYYTPTEQGGLPLAEMNPTQQRLAHRFIASGLTAPGYVAASTIMGIENILDSLEGWNHPYPGRAEPNRGRDPLLYFLSLFGSPSDSSWGWRLGGHHISVSYTIIDGRLASPTPLFFGANPAESRLVGPGLISPLSGEQALGRELLHALDSEQLASAVIAPQAPRDVVQSNRSNVEDRAVPRPTRQIFGRTVSDAAVRSFLATDGQDPDRTPPPFEYLEALRYGTTPKGLSATRMTAPQRELLTALVRQYVDRLPDDVADLYRARIAGPVLDGLHFAWAGGREHRQPHYYRIQGSRLLIEYDNIQDGANHVHSVMRDPEGDFGVDLLALHYQEAHR